MIAKLLQQASGGLGPCPLIPSPSHSKGRSSPEGLASKARDLHQIYFLVCSNYKSTSLHARQIQGRHERAPCPLRLPTLAWAYEGGKCPAATTETSWKTVALAKDRPLSSAVSTSNFSKRDTAGSRRKSARSQAFLSSDGDACTMADMIEHKRQLPSRCPALDSSTK